jgi:peptide/nickel transport system permease protein
VSAGYALRRIAFFFVIVWVAASVNFAILRLAPGDPVAGILVRIQQQGASVSGSDEIVRSYRQKFGLDEPIASQYLKYLANFARFDFGPSLSNYPAPVSTIIGAALPWTIGLLAVTTLIAFGLGTFLGALLAWRGTPAILRRTLPLLMLVAAVPYYLLAILLLAVLAFGFHLFPVAGTAPIGGLGATGLTRVGEILRSSFLPALSLVLGGLGGWMLGMRGLMIGVLESDYLMLAEAKGLSTRRILFRYAMRNAILPQITVLALALGSIASGAVLVEVIFSYPGLGSALYQAIQNADYTLIQGITFLLVIAVGAAVLILDLVYPLLDPRIRYERG